MWSFFIFKGYHSSEGYYSAGKQVQKGTNSVAKFWMNVRAHSPHMWIGAYVKFMECSLLATNN